MTGFKPMLEACDVSYGSIDEPSQVTEVQVWTQQGGEEYKTFDAVGIDGQADTTLLLGFDWIDPEEVDNEEIAEMVGEDIELIREEFQDPMMVLRSVVPFEEVTWTETTVEGLY